jgi:hypothetical protein
VLEEVVHLNVAFENTTRDDYKVVIIRKRHLGQPLNR